MKRFIQHDELARDSRFIRQPNVMVQVLASLPDGHRREELRSRHVR